MTTPFTPLTKIELQELDLFLLYEVQSDESMTSDTLDGYLHAIAIGPTSLMPQQWMPGIWGEGDSMMPPVESIEQLNRVLSLVMRHFNSIIAAMEQQPREIYPIWCNSEYRGKEYDDAEGWAYGFTEGMKLCWNDWEPLLKTPQGQAWYRPIGLLGEDDFSPEQDQLTKTPAKRGKLALQIPEAVVAMYEHWLPYRQAVYERQVAKTLQPKVGRNKDCALRQRKEVQEVLRRSFSSTLRHAMGLSSRRLLISDDGAIYRISNKRYDRMMRHPEDEPLANFANQRIRCADLVIDLIDRVPSSVCRETFAIFEFDHLGRLDTGRFEKQQVALIDAMLEPMLSNKNAATNVVDAAQRWFVAQGGTWLPSTALRVRIEKAALGLIDCVKV